MSSETGQVYVETRVAEKEAGMPTLSLASKSRSCSSGAVSAIFTKNTEAILKVRTAEKKAILQTCSFLQRTLICFQAHSSLETVKSKYEHAKPAWEARREALKGCEMPEL